MRPGTVQFEVLLQYRRDLPGKQDVDVQGGFLRVAKALHALGRLIRVRVDVTVEVRLLEEFLTLMRWWQDVGVGLAYR